MLFIYFFSVVSKLCHYVGSFFHLLLSNAASENEEEKSVASVSAILFFILALQTGLTSLEPEKRFSRICKNLCLLLTGNFGLDVLLTQIKEIYIRK